MAPWTRHVFYRAVALAGGHGLLAGEACAQDVDVGERAEVVVTATKRETRVQDTALSMTVVGQSALQTSGADDFADFALLVPGLTAIDSGPGNKRYALRGLQSPGEPEVALYYDEVPISGLPGGSLDTGASQPDFKLWDVERIEVLRGPQGTLYGNGAEGGAIRILSHRPDLERIEAVVEAGGSVTAGGGGAHRANALLNVPIVPGRFAVRIALYDRHDGGWIDDHARDDIDLPQIDQRNLNEEQTRGGRGSFTWRIFDQWTVTGIVWYQHLVTKSSFETYPAFAAPGAKYVSKAFAQTPWPDDAQLYNLISNYELSWATLFATGSYQYREAEQNTDTTRYLLHLSGCDEFSWNKSCFGPDLVPADSFARQSVSAWSAEARLVSKNPGALQWTLGSALQNASTQRQGEVARVDSQGFVRFDPQTGDALDRLFARQNHDEFKQYSFFGDVEYELVDGFKLGVGARWFHSDRSDEQTIVQQFFPGQPTGPQPFQQFKEGVLFKSFRLSYQQSPEALGYVQAAQGFRAGGPNYPGGFTLTAPPYRSDSVWSYEIGWKQTLADGGIRWNSALFDIEWSDLQLLVPTALFSYITNAGSARSSGFETELSAEIGADLQVTAGVSYNHARLVGPQPLSSDPASQLYPGARLAGVPEWTANTSLVKKHSFGNGYLATARIDASYQSGRASLVQKQSSAYFVTRDYELVNAHFGVAGPTGWSVSLDIENCFNRFAELSAKAEDANLVETVTAARPRTISIGLRKTYP